MDESIESLTKACWMEKVAVWIGCNEDKRWRQLTGIKKVLDVRKWRSNKNGLMEEVFTVGWLLIV